SCPSTINHQLSTSDSRPCPYRALPGCLFSRLGGRVAEGEQHLSCAFGFVAVQFAEGLAKGVEAEVGISFGAVNAVEKGGQFDELEPRVQEIEVENLLACHNRRCLIHYTRIFFAHNRGIACDHWPHAPSRCCWILQGCGA